MVALAVWLVLAAIVGLAGIVALYAVVAVLLVPFLAVGFVLAVLLAPFQYALEGWRARRAQARPPGLTLRERQWRAALADMFPEAQPYTLERRA